MGRNSSGNRGTSDGGGDFKGSVNNVESLKNIKDRQLYNDIGQAIGRYHSVMGVRQREVKLADLDGAYGAHVTANGQSQGVYLDKSYFKNSTRKSVTDEHKKNYDSGWSTRTNKPVAHTITHELAHATWNAHLTSPNALGAGQEIKALYKQWLGDKKKKGYGAYAKTNVSEFWAETVTKAVHGTSDKYTRAVKTIAKKYKL